MKIIESFYSIMRSGGNALSKGLETFFPLRMHRRYYYMLTAAAMLLSGCAEKAPAAETTESIAEAPQSDGSGAPAGISASLGQTTYPLSVKQLELLFVNDTDADYILGEGFVLTHTYTKDGKTVTESVPYTDNGDSFTAIGIVVPAKGTCRVTADLAAHYAPLSDNSGYYTVSYDGISTDFFVSKYAQDES